LRDHKRVSTSPDYWNFFKRYDIFDNVEFWTYNGVSVDQTTWTLEDHFNFFKNI